MRRSVRRRRSCSFEHANDKRLRVLAGGWDVRISAAQAGLPAGSDTDSVARSAIRPMAEGLYDEGPHNEADPRYKVHWWTTRPVVRSGRLRGSPIQLPLVMR